MTTPFCRATLALLLVLLAACTAPPAPPPSATASPPPPSATPRPSPTLRPPTATPAPPTPTPAPPALTIWVAEEGAAFAAVEAALSTFADGGTVRVLARPADTLRLSLAGDALLGTPPPDLIWADEETLAGLLADGQLRPLGPAFAEDALPALRTAATRDGELWGAPLTARDGLLLLYNRALAPEPPTTSDELIVRARAAMGPGTAGLAMAWGEPRWLLPWLYAFGGAPVGADGARPTLDSPAMAAAIDLLRELHSAAPRSGDGYYLGQRFFGQGQVALAIDGDWALPQYRALSATLDLGLAPLPRVPATGRPAHAPLGGDFLMFQRDLAGPRLARAEALVASLSEPGRQAALATRLGRLPASQAAISALPADSDAALRIIAADAAAAPGVPPTLASRCAIRAIDVWLPAVFRDATSATELAASMQREAEFCVTSAAAGS